MPIACSDSYQRVPVRGGGHGLQRRFNVVFREDFLERGPAAYVRPAADVAMIGVLQDVEHRVVRRVVLLPGVAACRLPR